MIASWPNLTNKWEQSKLLWANSGEALVNSAVDVVYRTKEWAHQSPARCLNVFGWVCTIHRQMINRTTSSESMVGRKPRGQHSFYQLMHQGRVVPSHFIGFAKSQNPAARRRSGNFKICRDIDLEILRGSQRIFFWREHLYPKKMTVA